MDAIVHIGYHKTASTWFQQNLYPKVSNYRFVDRRTVQKVFTRPRAFQFRSEMGERILSKLKAGKLILCEEKLSGNFHSGSLHGLLSKEIADRIYKVLPNSKIVIFIRNQLTMIPSAYSQYVKRGGTSKLKDYIYPKFNDSFLSPRFSLDNLIYNNLIDYYTNLFGFENVYIFLYEQFAKDNEKFIEEYCNTFELDCQIDTNLFNNKVNVSYHLKSIRYQRIINAFSNSPIVPKYYFIDTPKFREFATKFIQKHCKNKTSKESITITNLSSIELNQRIEKYFIKSNRVLNDKYNLNLDEYGYPL